MPPIVVLGIGLATAIAFVLVAWFVQLATRDAGIVDVLWSASIGALAVEFAVLGSAPGWLRVLLAALALTWSLRLAAYLTYRMRGAPEDSRYAAARASWGSRADAYLLLFFLFQALIATVLALPFLVIAFMQPGPAVWLALAAVIVWLASVVGEGVADAQLARFKRDPANRGKVCWRGLWRYSRHPNYFFESLHWVTYVVLAIGAAYWWVTLISPVLMAWLLLRVSGIPTIEKRGADQKRDGQDEYERSVSAFIPWPPKRDT